MEKRNAEKSYDNSFIKNHIRNGLSPTLSVKYRNNIPYLEYEIDENNIVNSAKNVLKFIRPSWDVDIVKFKFFTAGITNKLIGFYMNDSPSLPFHAEEDVVLVRIYGRNTESLIDRKAEIENFCLLFRKDLAPSLYAVFKNGFAYEYIHGVTLTPDTVVQPDIESLIAKQMAEIHKVLNVCTDQDATKSSVPFLWTKTQKFIDLIPTKYSDESKNARFKEKFPEKKKLREEFENLYRHLERLNSPIVFAHNDLLLGNIIYTAPKKRIYFIDYEYSGQNYQAYDIGNFFAEFCGVEEVDYTRYPTKEYQKNWLEIYLKAYLNVENVDQLDIDRLYVQVNKFALAAHFFWAMWALIQSEYSLIDFDFYNYAEIRYNEYLARKNEFLSLKF